MSNWNKPVRLLVGKLTPSCKLLMQGQVMSEGEDLEKVNVGEIETSSLQMPRVRKLLNEFPIIISLRELASSIYTRTRERNYGTQLGFGAAEVAWKAVVVTSHLTYSNLPECRLVGKLKQGFEQKVSQVDIMACDGLEFLQSKWPVIKDHTNEALSLTTSAGLGRARTAAQWSWNLTQHLLQKIPVVGQMVTAFLDPSHSGEFLFLPPIFGEGGLREIVGRKQKLRRSKRLKVKGDYHRMIDAAEPFPVSPDRKRKYDREEGEEALIEELIHVSENYVSDEDPDYVPDDDEDEESESLDDDDDDDDDDDEEDGTDEDEEQDEVDPKPLVKPEATGRADTKTKASIKPGATVQAVSQGKTESKSTASVKPEAAAQAISKEKPNFKSKASIKPESKGQATLQEKSDSQSRTSVKPNSTAQSISPGNNDPRSETSVKTEAATQAISQETAESKKTGKINGVETKPNAEDDAKKKKASIADTKNKGNGASGMKVVEAGLSNVFKAFNNKA